jgi:hypothetical protein
VIGRLAWLFATLAWLSLNLQPAFSAPCYEAFAPLREKLGSLIVGDCVGGPGLDTEGVYGGRAISQDTTTGTFTWRSTDGVAQFRNANTTWVDGPNGVEQRSNTDRLPWEIDESAAQARAAADAEREKSEEEHRKTSLQPFVGDWVRHGFGLTINTDGKSRAEWREYRWCSDGAPPPCDRIENDQIIGGGAADLEFFRPGLGQNFAVGIVTRTTGGVLVRGTLTIRLQQYGTATLEQDGASRTLCGPRYLELAPQWFFSTYPCGA